MEMTTPPNPSGFSKKPDPKNNRKYRGRKPLRKKEPGLSVSRITPEMAMYIVAGRLLLGAMQMLDGLIDDAAMPSNLRTAE